MPNIVDKKGAFRSEVSEIEPGKVYKASLLGTFSTTFEALLPKLKAAIATQAGLVQDGKPKIKINKLEIEKVEAVIDRLNLRLWWGATHPFSLWKEQQVYVCHVRIIMLKLNTGY